jgi:hypothetical protein
MKHQKLIFLLFIIISIGVTGCVKSDCEIDKFGTVTISNNSSNPYDIDLDGVHLIQLPGGSISDKIRINEGNNRTLHCKQVSGYIFFPTERTNTLNVVRCSDYTWQIP